MIEAEITEYFFFMYFLLIGENPSHIFIIFQFFYLMFFNVSVEAKFSLFLVYFEFILCMDKKNDGYVVVGGGTLTGV